MAKDKTANQEEKYCCNAPVMPLIGESAPQFKANTTMGPVNFPSDYKGRWVILFSHPADFTPVCTTEISRFAAMKDDFQALNTEVIGLSVDSVFSHKAWLMDIDQLKLCGPRTKVWFPIIEDLKMTVAGKYGMIHPAISDTSAIRAVFFVDPKGILRAMIYYPKNLGRNFAEIKRVVQALQKADEDKCVMPADWKPGMDVIVPGAQQKAVRRTQVQPGEIYSPRWYLPFRREGPASNAGRAARSAKKASAKKTAERKKQ